SGNLQPYEVTVGNAEVKAWEWRPGPAGSEGGGQLSLPLPEALHGTLPPVRVRCLAATAKDKKDRVWSSPGLRLRGALSRGETLRLEVLPEAQLESWKPGHFRLGKAVEEAGGSQVLTL